MNNNTKIDKNEWYRFNDVFFTYYINNVTFEKKLELDKNDKLVEPMLDDFINMKGVKYEQ